jgi:sugar (pentulose or hexulose) kinase
VELLRPKASEATALGTAMFCRAAIDPGAPLRDISRQWLRFDRRYTPDPRRTEAYRAMVGFFEEFLHAATDVAERWQEMGD